MNKYPEFADLVCHSYVPSTSTKITICRQKKHRRITSRKTSPYFEPLNKKHKRSVNGYTKKLVASSQGWKCASCFNLLPASFEIDHIVELCNGGSNEITNLQPLCNNCHGKKTFFFMAKYKKSQK